MLKKVSVEFRLVDSLPGDQPVMAIDDHGKIVALLNRSRSREAVAAALNVVMTAATEPYRLTRAV